MCYDANFHLQRLERLERALDKLSYDREALEKYGYQVSAFTNPDIPALKYTDPHLLDEVKWGFVPPFAKTPEEGEKWRAKSYNCRADTLLSKLKAGKHSMFKPMVKYPCVILMNGFYEWHTLPTGKKIPYYISMKDDSAFGVAGLMWTWQDFDDPALETTGATLCTIPANAMLSYILNIPTNSPDNRMPAILPYDQILNWLDTGIPPIERLSMLKPFPDALLKAHSVRHFKRRNFRIDHPARIIEPYDHGIAEVPVYVDGAFFN